MKNLKKEIDEKLDLIKNMIDKGENRLKIEEERKQLNQLLEKYVKEL